MVKITGPALQYFGGKWLAAPWIISHFPAHVCYCEPYAGGASVLLRKPPSKIEVYNDLDSAVVTFFRVLRDRPGELIRAIELTPYSREECDQSINKVGDELEIARRFCVRSYMASSSAQVSGGWSYNVTKASGLPSATWNDIPERLVVIAQRLKLVQIENSPALDTIKRFDAPGTLFYLDPPYLLETRPGSSGSYRQEMHTNPEHTELANLLNSISGMAIVSGYEHPLYDELYTGWRKVTRTFNTTGIIVDGTTIVTPRTEVLWLSPNITAKQPSLFDLDSV